MEKILQGARHEVDGLRNMTDTVSENQMFKLQEEIRGNSADMLVQLKNNERVNTFTVNLKPYVWMMVMCIL